MPSAAKTPWIRYEQRIAAVMEYIHANLHESLSNDQLADVAHLSPYHWHRIYRAITGESAAATVKRSRLNKAAADLIRTDKAIEAIGKSVGYPEVHSFTRTFKAYYGVAPGQFRQANKMATEQDIASGNVAQTSYPVAVDTKPDMHLVGLWHEGDYMEIGQTFEKVMALCQMNGILPTDPLTVGVYYCDPDITITSYLRSFAGVVVDAATAPPNGLEYIQYNGGNFACMTHQGPYALLNQSYHWLYGCWLPDSGYSVRDQPCCEVYLNTPVNTDPADLLTQICLPIA
jgi:AraC family transcriptional regulator